MRFGNLGNQQGRRGRGKRLPSGSKPGLLPFLPTYTVIRREYTVSWRAMRETYRMLEDARNELDDAFYVYDEHGRLVFGTTTSVNCSG